MMPVCAHARVRVGTTWQLDYQPGVDNPTQSLAESIPIPEKDLNKWAKSAQIKPPRGTTNHKQSLKIGSQKRALKMEQTKTWTK